jgi:hypothetical protein
MPRRIPQLLLLAVLVTATIGAFTNPDPGDANQSPSASGGAGPSFADSEAAAELGIPIDVDSPFDPYMPYVNGPEPDAAAAAVAAEQLRTRWTQMQGAQAECMKDRGFTYYPVPWVANTEYRRFPNGDVLVLPRLPASRAEVERRGYGIQAAEDFTDEATEVEEQNRNYRESLAPAAQTEYDLALLGPDPHEATPEDTANTCGEIAAQAVPVDDSDWVPPPADEFWFEFGDLVLAMAELVDIGAPSDPAVQNAAQAWESCMAKKGYDFTTSRFLQYGPINPWAAHTLALRTLPDGSVGDAWHNYQGENFTRPEERSLSGSPAEIKIAVDDFDCRVEADYEAIHLEAQLRLEAEFVAQNKARLDAMVAFVTTANGS